MQPAIALHAVDTEQTDENLVATVYRFAATAGGITTFDDAASALSLTHDEVADAIGQLLSDRLLRRSGPVGDAGDGLLVAVDPEVAAAALVSPMERDIARRREQIDRVKQRTERYRTDYACAPDRQHLRTGVAHVIGDAEVRGQLDLAVARCRTEILILKSGKQDDDGLTGLIELCGPLLERGVAVRIICLHRSRAELTIRTRLKRLSDAGGQIRTLSHIPRSAVVIDGAEAVLLGDSEGGSTACCLRGDPELLQFLLDLFAHLWDGGAPYDASESGYGVVADDLQRTIVELMAQGLTDEVVARKLGMSVRSCRRHIATLLQELGAVSRFQAGLNAGRRKMLDVSG